MRRFLERFTVSTYRRVLYAVAATVVIVVLVLPDVSAGLVNLTHAEQVNWRYWVIAFVVGVLFVGRIRRRALLRAMSGPSAHQHKSNLGVAVAIPVIGAVSLLTANYVYTHTPQGTAQSPATQAVQSAALVGGLLGAALTLWIADRRRVHDTESLALDRERNDDERFTQALQLLGHKEASVRVGAMHALDTLARTAAARRQTVVDVLCAYLRQPFHHHEWPSTIDVNHRVAGWVSSTWQVLFSRGQQYELDREREVRRTALQLVLGLLPQAKQTEEDARWDRRSRFQGNDVTGWQLLRVRDLLWGLIPHAEEDPFAGADVLSLDLNGAALDDFVLQGRMLSGTFRRAQVHGRTELHDVRFAGDCNWQDVAFHGPVHMSSVEVQGRALFDRARFHAGSRLSWVKTSEGWGFDGAQFYAPAVLRRLQPISGDGGYSVTFKNACFQGSATVWFEGYVHYSFDGCEFKNDIWLSIGPGSVPAEDAIYVSGQHSCELPTGWELQHPGAARTRIVLPERTA